MGARGEMGFDWESFAGMAEALLLPPGPWLTLALLALALATRGRCRQAAALGGLAAVGLWASSMPATANRLLHALQAPYAFRPAEAIAKADLILVLGGGVAPAGAAGQPDDLGAAADRVLYAARLYRAGKAPLVIVSGGPSRGRSEADAMATLLGEWGLPPEAILREPASTSTRTNCTRVRDLLVQRESLSARILLVTSAIHMQRAIRSCRRAGLRVEAAPTDFQRMPQTGITRWLPDAEALYIGSQTLREWVARGIYDLGEAVAP